MNFCPHCGLKISVEGKYCTGCGGLLSSQAAPASQPRSDVTPSKRGPPYSSYEQVPFYQKQWFFWLTYVFLSPVAVTILALGDVYYEKDGKVKSFGPANRVIAALFALWIIYKFWSALTPLLAHK